MVDFPHQLTLDKKKYLCGAELGAPNKEDCLACDRTYRDEKRAMFNLPPLTDEQHKRLFRLAKARKTGKMIMVIGGTATGTYGV